MAKRCCKWNSTSFCFHYSSSFQVYTTQICSLHLRSSRLTYAGRRGRRVPETDGSGSSRMLSLGWWRWGRARRISFGCQGILEVCKSSRRQIEFEENTRYLIRLFWEHILKVRNYASTLSIPLTRCRFHYNEHFHRIHRHKRHPKTGSRPLASIVIACIFCGFCCLEQRSSTR